MHRGPQLPYQLLAGVVPFPRGWVVAPGKLVGITLYPDEPQTVPAFRDVIDAIPSYVVIALAAPIGLPDAPHRGGRKAERDARQLLGFPHSGAIASAPARQVLGATTYAKALRLNGGALDIITWQHLDHIAEVNGEMQPYLQRRVFEVQPELSFFQLNDDEPLRTRKRSAAGLVERRELLLRRLPGAERVLDAALPRVRPSHLVDACAALWTARRISARAVSRLPEDPEWNADGLRMEIIR
jgi:predicted RNase H-like nuclease